tara:strand:- start:424 stop:918 length:495 start_codon:yes stop_codon:yes gene_type:complete
MTLGESAHNLGSVPVNLSVWPVSDLTPIMVADGPPFFGKAVIRFPKNLSHFFAYPFFRLKCENAELRGKAIVGQQIGPTSNGTCRASLPVEYRIRTTALTSGCRRRRSNAIRAAFRISQCFDGKYGRIRGKSLRMCKGSSDRKLAQNVTRHNKSPERAFSACVF